MSQHFEPTFESLRGYEAPEWFRDAKFGIWSHWGPQSVPMFGDWYARNMYIEGTPQYEYHLRHYGHPSKVGWKDICAMWKAENFDPEGLAERYRKAGARYLMTQATHHDHFFNYDSKINRMNSVNVGPHKDILALWKKAADRQGMKFGLTEHDKFGPYAGVPYDGNDPAYRDFYHDNYEHGTDDPGSINPWYTSNKGFQAYWQRCVFEMIEKFHPDVVYTDGVLPFGGHWMDEKIEDIREETYSTTTGQTRPCTCRRTGSRRSSRSACWTLKRANCPASCRIPGIPTPASETGSTTCTPPTSVRSRSSRCWWTSSPRTASCS